MKVTFVSILLFVNVSFCSNSLLCLETLKAPRAEHNKNLAIRSLRRFFDTNSSILQMMRGIYPPGDVPENEIIYPIVESIEPYLSRIYYNFVFGLREELKVFKHDRFPISMVKYCVQVLDSLEKKYLDGESIFFTIDEVLMLMYFQHFFEGYYISWITGGFEGEPRD